MKKIFTLLALCALTMSANATYRVYLCGITELTVDTLQSTSKNQFTLHFHQKCKNKAEYSKPETFYESDVKLVLNSDDRTLEGTYTTEGASKTSSSSNVNDQTINLITSEFTSGSTSRVLHKDSISTFTIEKIDDTHYAVTAGNLVFSQRLEQIDVWAYRYSYDPEHILEQGIAPTPYVFGWEAGYFEKYYNYDLTVNSLNILNSPTDYESLRYIFTMQCTGICRETQAQHDYEVQLSIYPENNAINGTFATQGTRDVLIGMTSYVKDLDQSKQRYLNNDSISQITIVNKGGQKYNFKGGPLLCTDLDANYSAVYGKKRIEATHYYYFDFKGADGLDFTFDGVNTEIIQPGAEGIINVDADAKTLKQLRNGQMVIIRGEHEYDARGTQLK